MSDGERLGILETKMDAVEVVTADHESRIRSSEKLGYGILAVAAAGSMIGGALTTLVTFLVAR